MFQNVPARLSCYLAHECSNQRRFLSSVSTRSLLHSFLSLWEGGKGQTETLSLPWGRCRWWFGAESHPSWPKFGCVWLWGLGSSRITNRDQLLIQVELWISRYQTSSWLVHCQSSLVTAVSPRQSILALAFWPPFYNLKSISTVTKIRNIK